MAREVKVIITGDNTSLNKALGGAARDADSFAGKMSKIGDGMTRLGKGITLGVTLPLIAIGKKALDASGEAQLIASQTAAALKSTGGAAHVTAGEIENLAKAIDKKSLADDEAIQSGANLLLTFTNIQNRVGAGNDIFNQATQTIADMSQALGQDLSASAMQLGKALNDPIEGITALRRVGVAFTDDQKKQIETMVKAGDIAGAQKIILAELNKEFGGSAAAAANTGIGKRKQALDELGNALERIGDIISPVVAKGAEALTRLLDRFEKLTPKQQEFGVKMAGIAAAIGPVLLVLGKFATAISAIAGLFAEGGLLAGITLAGAAMAAVWIIIAAAVIALVIIIIKNWDTIKAALAAAWEWIKQTASDIWNALKDTIGGAMTAIGDALFAAWEAIKLALSTAWEWIKSTAATVFWAVAQAIVGPFIPVKNMLGLMWEVIKAAAILAWDFLKAAAAGAWTIIKLAIVDPIIAAWHLLGTIWDGIKLAASTAWNILKAQAQGVWALIKLVIVNPMISAKDLLIAAFNAVKDSLIGSWNTIKSGIANAVSFVAGKFEWLRDKIAGIVDWIKNKIAGLPFMHNSPSEMEISANITTANVVDQMRKLADGVDGALSGTGFGGFGGGTSAPAMAAAAAQTVNVPISIQGATIDQILDQVRYALERVGDRNGGKVFSFSG